MESNIKVSVIVPVYNVEQYLNRCVDSIINQTLKEIEIILVDDGSPDKSSTICDEYALKDSRIKVIHKVNGGLSSARNAGIKVAQGDYIFFVDSDDWLELDGLELLYTKAIEYDVDFVRYRAIRTGWPGLEYNAPCMLEVPREIPGGLYDKKRIVEEIYPKLIITEQFTTGPILGAWGSLYKRSLLTNNNILFYDEIKFSEDMIFSAKVVTSSDSFYYIENACVYHYFYNPNSISKSFRANRWDSCKENIRLFEKDFSNYKEYDFSAQLNRLRWFCVFMGLNERKYLTKRKDKLLYCKLIINDEITRNTKIKYNEYNISIKQQLLFIIIKLKLSILFLLCK